MTDLRPIIILMREAAYDLAARDDFANARVVNGAVIFRCPGCGGDTRCGGALCGAECPSLAQPEYYGGMRAMTRARRLLESAADLEKEINYDTPSAAPMTVTDKMIEGAISACLAQKNVTASDRRASRDDPQFREDIRVALTGALCTPSPEPTTDG